MALTKTEAKILAYVYERGWVEDFKISRYIAVRESHLQTLLSNEPTSALVGMLQLKGRTLAEQRAVTAELKRRGIVAPKRRGRK